MTKEQTNLPEQLHSWYLEAVKELKPESFNPNANKPYSEITDEQKSIDIYIANKITDLISQEKEKWVAEKVKQLTPPESWKQCLKIGTGQDEMCMMCGFNPKELINLLQK